MDAPLTLIRETGESNYYTLYYLRAGSYAFYVAILVLIRNSYNVLPQAKVCTFSAQDLRHTDCLMTYLPFGHWTFIGRRKTYYKKLCSQRQQLIFNSTSTKVGFLLSSSAPSCRNYLRPFSIYISFYSKDSQE